MRRAVGRTEPDDGFHVDLWVHLLSGFVSRHPGLWTWLGNLETHGLADDSLARVDVRRPVYIAGLARSGSTLLLEILNQHPDLGSHRYKDFPLLFTPYWWNRYLDRAPRPEFKAVERPHKDGIFITPESPEAFEEMLWMAFFPDLHDPSKPGVLNQGTDNPAFERFYRDHIRKLLLVRGSRRYLSKGNYNITRLSYLLKMFADARILIPVREPVWHIASLIKQHAIFRRGQETHPRAVAHLRRVGHFEFGLDRRPIHTGSDEHLRQITALWARGAEVEGWARYWACVHDYLADGLEADPVLREAVLVVRYEALCSAPAETLSAVFAHCGLTAREEIMRQALRRIWPPAYDRPGLFSDRDLEVIAEYTQAAAGRFGLGRFTNFNPAETRPVVRRFL